MHACSLNVKIYQSVVMCSIIFIVLIMFLITLIISATFAKMKTAENRKENGISFVQSALFLQILLVALSTDSKNRKEIEDCLKLKIPEEEKNDIIKRTLSLFPRSDNALKFHWSYRLALRPGFVLNDEFRTGAAAALHLHEHRFNGTETPEDIANILNNMVEIDSGGAIHNTFTKDDITEESNAIFLTTVYIRGRWRSAPTVLNGTLPFMDVENTPQRNVRCIRINDNMRYADLSEWDAEAIEIFYATQGLSLFIIVPRGRSLRLLADRVAMTSIHLISERMQTMRIAATLPLYTLRMTLLLPDKLRALGMPRLAQVNTAESDLTLSHGVQRLMFWAEAGRNAYKDDGNTYSMFS
uniref:Serpin domain-containing protein n=2 Tax=Bombyx mori TaxID=7091 RepID=A0A8R2C6Z5_BOMMO|nr:serine protease inhibitor 29 isoform X1 [Bombyx mori]